MHAVTCRTEGCENEGYTIVLNQPGHSIVCGPCGSLIVDIDPPLPEVPEWQHGPSEAEGPDGNLD